MGEGRVKTAVELAMEKIANMPKLDTEEMRLQNEQKMHSEGVDIVQRYINYPGKKIDFKEELRRYKPEDLNIVKKGIVEAFCMSLNLTDKNKNQIVFIGLRSVFENAELENIVEHLNKVQSDFKVSLNEAYSEMETTQLEELKDTGISGTAIRPNLFINEDWKNKASEIETLFVTSLKQIRSDIASVAV